MVLMQNLASIVSLLESYRGRDRILRLSTYIAMFMGSNGKTAAQMKWRIFMGELGGCRMFLRMFDDLSYLMLNIKTGFGMQDKRPLIKILNLMTALLNTGFYPSEHIAWLRQKKIISGEPGPYIILGIFIWAASLAVEVVKSFLKIHYINVQANQLRKQKELDKSSEGDDASSSQNDEIKKTLGSLSKEKQDVKLVMFQSLFDLTNAVSWLPPGFLWAGTLTPRMNGICGLLSTLIMLYRTWPPPKPM